MTENKRFNMNSDAAKRPIEEQHRLIDQFESERYDNSAVQTDEKAYEKSMENRQAYQAEMENDRKYELEQIILGNPETRRLYMIAQNISELRRDRADYPGADLIIRDKEDNLFDLIEKYKMQNSGIIDFIIDTAAEEAASSDLEINTPNIGVDGNKQSGLEPSVIGEPTELEPSQVSAGSEADEKDLEKKAVLSDKLGGLRTSFAEITAKQSSRIFSFSESRQKYESIRKEYKETLVALGKQVEADLEETNPDRTKEQRNADVIKFILEEQARLREETQEKFKDTKVSKFIDWFTSGSRAQTFAKGALMSGGIAAIGLLSGGIGLGVGITAAGAAGLGARFARGYALSDKDRGLKDVDQAITEDKQEELGEIIKNSDTSYEGAAEFAIGTIDKERDEQQSKRRRALGRAAVLTGVSLVIGSAVSVASDYIGDLLDTGAGAISDQVGDVLPEVHNWSPDAMTINPGEGWYQTFQEMGIDSSGWSGLLEKVGPELQSRGWAYQMSNGSWGISQPGQLPSDVLELIWNNR